MGRYEEALVDFNQAIALDDKNTGAFTSRGQTYRLMERYEEALVDFNQAIALNDKSSWVFAQRGETYRLMERYAEALTDLNYALTLGSDTYNLRGLVFSYLGCYDEAINSYLQGLEKAPQNISLLYNIAVSMVRWKGISFAQKYVDEALNALQNNLITDSRGSALYGLGGLNAIIGNFDSALDYLEQATAIEKDAIIWARQDMAWEELRSGNNLRFQVLVFTT